MVVLFARGCARLLLEAVLITESDQSVDVIFADAKPALPILGLEVDGRRSRFTELAEILDVLVDQVADDLIELDLDDLQLFFLEIDLGEEGDEEIGLERDTAGDPEEALQHSEVGKRSDDRFDLLVQRLELLEDHSVGGTALDAGHGTLLEWPRWAEKGVIE